MDRSLPSAPAAECPEPGAISSSGYGATTPSSPLQMLSIVRASGFGQPAAAQMRSPSFAVADSIGLFNPGQLVEANATARYEKSGREAGFRSTAKVGSAGRIRTYDQPVNSRLLYH